AVSSVTQANTSTASCADADPCTEIDPVSPSGTSARFDAVAPGAGSASAGAFGGGAPVGHTPTLPGASAAVALSCTSTAVAPVGGGPPSGATVTWPAIAAPLAVTLSATALTSAAGTPAWPSTGTATGNPAVTRWNASAAAGAATTRLAPPGTTGSGSRVL